MKKVPILLITISLLLSGCQFAETSVPATETPIPIGTRIADAVSATLQAEEESFSPAFPYTPAQLAVLLEPGSDLDGRWVPSSVTDITQPIPGYACGGYYGSCWGDWGRKLQYGTTLLLLLDDDRLGEIDFIYYEDLANVENAYQLFLSKWSSWEDVPVNPYQRDLLGEKWLHRLYYVEIEDQDASTPEQAQWVEVLSMNIAFARCHGFVVIELAFPAQTPLSSRGDYSPERLEEMETLFDLAYQYARSVDERITPYACNP